MNIFVTDICPIRSAQALDNVRLNKMVIESAQILSTVYDVGYKSTHQHHPCTKWAAEHPTHAAWLLWHYEALLNEFFERFGKAHGAGKHEALFVEKVNEALGGGNTCRTVDRPKTWHVAVSEQMPGHFVSGRTTEPFEPYRKYMMWKWMNDTFAGRSPRWGFRGKPLWATNLYQAA